MKNLRASQQFDSLYSCSDRLKEEESLSLDDINAANKGTTSSTSIFNDYGFSDDEEEKQASFMMQESLYFDADLKEKRTKKATKQQKEPASRTSGALEELFASTPAPPAKTPKQNRPKRSSAPSTKKYGTIGLETPLSAAAARSRSSPAISGLPSPRGRSISNNGHNSSSGAKNFVWEIDEDDYETDTDDEGLEFGSDCNEVPPSKRKSLMKKVMARVEGQIPRTPVKRSSSLKRSSSVKRMMESMTLSGHRRDGSENSERRRRSLSISRRSTRRDDESSSTRKLRSFSLTGPRQRRACTKKDFLEGSSTDTTSVGRSKTRRSSSLKGSSSSQCLSLDLDDVPSTPKERKRRSLSNKPRRSKKKSGLDQSSHSSPGNNNDDKSQRSVSVNRRKKKSLDHSSHKRSSSISSGKRSSSVKKKKNKDQMNGLSDPQANSEMMSPQLVKQRRVRIKRSSSSVVDDSIKKSESSSQSLLSNSRPGKRSSKISKRSSKTKGSISPTRSSKTKRSKSPKNSDTLLARSEEFTTSSTNRRQLNNMSLSSSEHGRPSRRSTVKVGGSREFELLLQRVER